MQLESVFATMNHKPCRAAQLRAVQLGGLPATVVQLFFQGVSALPALVPTHAHPLHPSNGSATGNGLRPQVKSAKQPLSLSSHAYSEVAQSQVALKKKKATFLTMRNDLGHFELTLYLPGLLLPAPA